MNDNNIYIHNYALEYDQQKQKKKKRKRILLILLLLILLSILSFILYELYFNKNNNSNSNSNYEEYNPNYVEEESNKTSNSNVISNSNMSNSNEEIESNSNIETSNTNSDSNIETSNNSNNEVISNKTSNSNVEKDNTKPTISSISLTSTTNSITVKATYSDNKTSTSKLNVLYSKDNKNWQKSNVFSGLKQNTKYDIYVKVTDEAGNYIIKSKSITTKVEAARSNVSGVYTLDSDTIYVAELSDKSIVYSIGTPTKKSFKLLSLSSNANGVKTYSSNIKFDNTYLIYNNKKLVRKSNYTLNQVFESYYGGTFDSSSNLCGYFYNINIVAYGFDVIPYILSDGSKKGYITLHNSSVTENITADLSGNTLYYKEGGLNHTIAKFSGTLESSGIFKLSTSAYAPARPLYSMSGDYILKTKYNLEYIIKNKIVTK